MSRQVFKTADGLEFTTATAAARHEARLKALIKFEAAQRGLSWALAEDAHTADGQPFEVGRDYWCIQESYWGGHSLPCLRRVTVYPYSTVAIDDPDGVILRVRADARDQPDRVYRVCNLYASEAAAKAALLAACEARLVEITDFVEVLRREVEGGSHER